MAAWVRGTAVAACFLSFGCGGDGAPPRGETCAGGEFVQEVDGQTFTQLSVGTARACGVTGDGRVHCWGDGTYTPEPVDGVEGATSVVVSSPNTCAIVAGGRVVCWNDFEPGVKAVPGLCGATDLALSVAPSCAVVEDGTVRCWGGLQESVFGKSSSETPVKVPSVRDAVAVAVGPSGYACALIADGTVTCWGGGPRGGERPGIEPAAVPEIVGATALSGAELGDFEMCATLDDGTIGCWTHAAESTPVSGLVDVASLAIAPSHSCAALLDGTVHCWGRNQSGQLGNGTQEDSDEPVEVEGLSGAVAVSVNSLDSTIGQSCALLDDDTARCWGANFNGQLGNGTVTDESTPVEVETPQAR